MNETSKGKRVLAQFEKLKNCSQTCLIWSLFFLSSLEVVSGMSLQCRCYELLWSIFNAAVPINYLHQAVNIFVGIYIF